MKTVMTLEVDANLGAAYLQFSDRDVAETVELTPEVQVDVDAFGNLVGVEILELGADVPVTELESRFNITPSQRVAVNQLRASLASFSTMSSSGPGIGNVQLQPA